MGKIVAVAPHPDDEVIGCGGALIHHARAGHQVTVITFGERLSSPRETDITRDEYLREGEEALAALGVTRHVALNLKARDFTVTHALVLRLVEELRRERPEVVFLPHEDEADAEHRQAHQAAVEALWMAQSVYFEAHGPPMPPPELVLGYEVWTPLSRFQYAEDISDAIDQKVAAMRCYRSQLRHGAWDDAIRGLAAYRGAMTGAGAYAEVYVVLHTSGRWRPRD
jgi:N-acetylglucosamine malate deacetylase 1